MLYTVWPDYGVPQSAKALLQFLSLVRQQQSKLLASRGDTWAGHPRGPPIVVHCSAGIGRTGRQMLLAIVIYLVLCFFFSNKNLGTIYIYINLARFQAHFAPWIFAYRDWRTLEPQTYEELSRRSEHKGPTVFKCQTSTSFVIVLWRNTRFPKGCSVRSISPCYLHRSKRILTKRVTSSAIIYRINVLPEYAYIYIYIILKIAYFYLKRLKVIFCYHIHRCND